jgi:metal-responsive CopG/Arc/MetJ family transcriptional regulator
MGRKAGPTKYTKVFRITPDDDRKLEEILEFWQRSKGFYNMKTYTRSDVVGQALRQYWLQQRAKVKTDGKFCGVCQQPIERER